MSVRGEGDSTPLNLRLPLLQEQRRLSQQAEGLLFPTFPHLELRLRKERQLLFLEWKTLVACAVFLNYFAIIVFRNFAYFRYSTRMKPLNDLGHELVPEMPEVFWVELPIYGMFAIMILSSCGAFLFHNGKHPQSQDKPYFINALRRTMLVFSVGHFLRAMTYLSTDLPGPSKHCLLPELLDPPPTLASCFYRLVSTNGNCGDLNFSGHMFLFHMGTLYIDEFGPKMWNQPRWSNFHMWTTGVSLAASVLQVVFILGARHHYSVDIVLATYMAPLLWSFFKEHLKDVIPDEGLIENELMKESTWPRWMRLCNVAGSFLFVAVLLGSLIFSFGGNYHAVIKTD